MRCSLPVWLLSGFQLPVMVFSLLCRLTHLYCRFIKAVWQCLLVLFLPSVIKICPCILPNQKPFLDQWILPHSFCSVFFCISSINWRLFICSVVDLWGVNPYYYNWYASCCKKCNFSFACIHLSNIFNNICLRDMGL